MNIDPDSIRLVGEADLLELAGLGRGAWHSWIKSEHVSQSPDGLYREQDVIELAVLRLLGESMPLPKAVIAWRDCQVDLIGRYTDRRLDDHAPMDLVVDLYTLAALCTEGPKGLFDAVHERAPTPRGILVIAVGEIVDELRAAFWRRARPAAEFTHDKRRRSAQKDSGGTKKAIPISQAREDQ